MNTKYCKINEVEIKNPSSFTITRYRITDAQRLSSGDMSMEHKARKKKFSLTWAAIRSRDLDKILDEIWETNNCFFDFTYSYGDNKTETLHCYHGELPTELHRGGTSDWVWKNVQIDIIQK